MILPQLVATKTQEKYNNDVDMWSEKQVTLILLVFTKFAKQIIIMQHLVEVLISLLIKIWFLHFSCLYLLVALQIVEIRF